MAEAEQTNQRELTFGERAAGVGFNPSELPNVDDIKADAARQIDRLNSMRNDTDDPEVKRMCALAITHLQEAQMWGVKAATWNVGKK